MAEMISDSLICVASINRPSGGEAVADEPADDALQEVADIEILSLGQGERWEIAPKEP